MKNYISIFLLCLISYGSSAQKAVKSALEIGQSCPDFNFLEVANYTTNSVSLNDLKGKYFILDFWAKTCASCIENMPKVNRLQQAFKDKIQIILSGDDDKEGEMRKIYSRIKEKYKMIVPCAYDRSVIRQFRQDGVVPLLIWVDKDGIVKAVTTSDDLNEKNLNKFINGESFVHADFTSAGQGTSYRELKEKKDRLFSVDEKDKSDLLYRSTLLSCDHYEGALYEPGEIDEDPIRDNRTQISLIKITVPALYRLAYFGKIAIPNIRIAIEVKDSSNLYEADQKTLANYCYSLQAPKNRATKDDLMSMMQNDLMKFFGYEANFEDRAAPAYFLKIIDQAKANQLLSRSNGEQTGQWAKKVGGKLENSTMENFCNILRMDLPSNVVLVDQTGIKEKINIEFKNASLVDVEGMRAALQKNGLDIISGNSLMSVLVIKDSKHISGATARN